MKQCYKERGFRKDAIDLISHINGIVIDYQRQGFRLTTRQIYYQLVSRDIISNTLQEYKRVASIINDGKLAGLIDWEAIEDRTREFIRRQRWESGAQILKACVSSYHQDMWENQEHRIFVIVEKEALVGIMEPTCKNWDIPLLAARGYPSGTVLREFVESDIISTLACGQRPVIFHLGDHDPSGIDMSRDLEERINLFASPEDGAYVVLERLALNMPQIEEIKPPENPAKVTDSRFDAYMKKFGTKSWELDALSPAYIANLLEAQIHPYVDFSAWESREAEVNDVKTKILTLSKQFEKV